MSFCDAYHVVFRGPCRVAKRRVYRVGEVKLWGRGIVVFLRTIDEIQRVETIDDINRQPKLTVLHCFGLYSLVSHATVPRQPLN